MIVRSFILLNPAPIFARRPGIKADIYRYNSWANDGYTPEHVLMIPHFFIPMYITCPYEMHMLPVYQLTLKYIKNSVAVHSTHVPAVPKAILEPRRAINSSSFPSSASRWISESVESFCNIGREERWPMKDSVGEQTMGWKKGFLTDYLEVICSN